VKTENIKNGMLIRVSKTYVLESWVLKKKKREVGRVIMIVGIIKRPVTAKKSGAYCLLFLCFI